MAGADPDDRCSDVIVHLAILRLALVLPTFPLASSARERRSNHEQLHPQQYLDLPDRRLRGVRFLTGLLSFFAICSVGVIANVGIAAAVFQQHYAWWLSALAGIAVGLVGNYAVSSVFTGVAHLD